MAKNGYVGVEGKAKKIGKYFVGVDGKARKVSKAYVGDALGKARLFFEAHTHSFTVNLGLSYDDNQHWRVRQCECGETENSEYGNHYSYSGPYYTNYTWNTSQHRKYYKCVCGKTYGGSYITHSFSSQGTIAGSDSTGHWYNTKCVCGKTSTSASEAHSQWTEKIVKAATCSTNGTKGLTCGVCGYYKTEIIPANGEHEWSLIASGGRRCLLCGLSEVFENM